MSNGGPDRVLSPEEVRTYLEAPMTEDEREHVLALARWFRRRYPTPLERLAYVRRAYARWQRTRGLVAPTPDGPDDVTDSTS